MSESPKKRGRPKKVDTTKKYNLSVSIGEFVFDVMTDDLVGSLLDIHPTKVMQRVIFKVSDGSKKAEQMLFPLRAKRIFLNQFAAQFFVKRLLLSMK